MKTIIFEPTYKRENGLYVVNLDQIEQSIPFPVKEKTIVVIPSNQAGGNHKHPRQECFFSTGNNLELIWRDSAENIHREKMLPFTLYHITPFLPHAVINTSQDHPETLIEFADGPQRDVEIVNLV